MAVGSSEVTAEGLILFTLCTVCWNNPYHPGSKHLASCELAAVSLLLIACYLKCNP